MRVYGGRSGQTLRRCQPRSFRGSIPNVMVLFGPWVFQPVVSFCSGCQYLRCLPWASFLFLCNELIWFTYCCFFLWCFTVHGEPVTEHSLPMTPLGVIGKLCSLTGSPWTFSLIFLYMIINYNSYGLQKLETSIFCFSELSKSRNSSWVHVY